LIKVRVSSKIHRCYLVSESTGETLITVARAVARKYANVTPVEHVYPLVRSQKQLDRVLDDRTPKARAFCCWRLQPSEPSRRNSIGADVRRPKP
jgi:hypothetical protein